MLTTQDKKFIEDVIESKLEAKLEAKLDAKFGEFAIFVQNGFDHIFKVLDTKADKEDVKRLERRIDVLEYKVVGSQGRRLDKAEDDIRLIKTNLKLS